MPEEVLQWLQFSFSASPASHSMWRAGGAQQIVGLVKWRHFDRIVGLFSRITGLFWQIAAVFVCGVGAYISLFTLALCAESMRRCSMTQIQIFFL